MSSLPRFAHILFIPFLLTGTMGRVHAADREPNAEILQHLCRETVAAIIVEMTIPETTTVALKLEKGERNSFFAQSIAESLRKRFSSLFTQTAGSGVELSVTMGKVSVVYGRPFSEGFFAANKSERQIDVTVRMTAVRIGDGKILWSGSRTGVHIDTVSVADIPEIQQTSEWVARGEMPERSAVEKFVEPFIVVGAAAVAIYLFFTIRS